MSAVIKSHAKCEMCTVIQFFAAKNLFNGDNSQRFCTVCRQKVVSVWVVWEWDIQQWSDLIFLLLNTGIHVERCGRISVVTDEHVGKLTGFVTLTAFDPYTAKFSMNCGCKIILHFVKTQMTAHTLHLVGLLMTTDILMIYRKLTSTQAIFTVPWLMTDHICTLIKE